MNELETLKAECENALLASRNPSLTTPQAAGFLASCFDDYAKAFVRQANPNIPKNCKGAYHRNLRLAFASYLQGERLETSSDLRQILTSRIIRWLLGKHTDFRVNWDDDEIEDAKAQRIKEVVEFLKTDPMAQDGLNFQPKPRKQKK